MGQGLADAVGFKEPPLTVEESAKGMVEQVCSALVTWSWCRVTDKSFFLCRLTP